MDKIKVLKIEPYKFPKEVEIDNGLESLQEQVGGYIEQYMPFTDEVALIVNEEGKIHGMELNRAVYDEDTHEMIDIIAGTFLIAWAAWDSGDFESLPDDMVEKYKKLFYYPEAFFRTNGGIKAVRVMPDDELS